jgi:tetratricopeptide (TPR) repeat protein
VTDHRTAEPPATGSIPAEQAEALRIWAGVPLRNSAFTGRETLLSTLRKALDRQSKASVVPHALHGLGGVGKTQLAVEFAYRYADRYDVVWWIPAENQTLVLQSLRDLGKRLGTPETASLQQAARLVLDRLATTPLRWLLIYDNANDPDDVVNFIPSGGGHIILTSRNQTWSELWDPIKVDVFDRDESVELVRKRGFEVSSTDAERLATRLDDLPLALDQAASCQAATGMSVDEYLASLDTHIDALSPGRPATSRTTTVTVAALVRLTLEQLRANAPAAGELLEMFAYLGAEPISGRLLRRGRDARISEALGKALRDPNALGRAIRQLSQYGIARVDADRRIQVHRLFQLVLRDQLSEETLARSRVNVHQVLASANPGYPASDETWRDHAEIGPHIGPAGLIESEFIDARRVVLDQAVYLLQIGDLEGSRRLAQTAMDAWDKTEGVPGLGPNGELTLQVAFPLMTTLRLLGFNDRARGLAEDVYDRLKNSTDFGPNHEVTLQAADEVAPNLRVAGLFREALELDRDWAARSRRLFGQDDPNALRAQGNLAVNLRMLSDFPGAFDIDTAAVHAWQQNVSENDNRLLFAQTNLARDLYGLGRYSEALSLQQRILTPFREQRGPRHPHVLLARRTLAITLRKVGRFGEALTVAREHHADAVDVFGYDHEHSLAAAMTLANSHRVVGELDRANELATEAVTRYLRLFGEDHPLTLSATVNHAIVLRALGEHERAMRLDEDSHARMTENLGSPHGYALCALNGLAIDLALSGDLIRARAMFDEALVISHRSRGAGHPYTLACAVNAAIAGSTDGSSGDGVAGAASLDQAVAGLADVLGVDHPETTAARARAWAECDIEPPPT